MYLLLFGVAMAVALFARVIRVPHTVSLVVAGLTITFGVVVLSILIQGTTTGPLLRRLGLVEARPNRLPYETKVGVIQCARAALDSLADLARSHFVSASVREDVRQSYQHRIAALEAEVSSLHSEETLLADEEKALLSQQMLVVEKKTALEANQRGNLSDQAFRAIVKDIDERLLAMENS